MTVSVSTNKNEFIGNGSLVAFDYTFVAYSDSSVKVEIDGVEQISGFTIARNSNSIGGRVTFSTAPASDAQITIRREIPLTQSLDLVRFGRFPAESVERALDEGVMVDQQLLERIDNEREFVESEVARVLAKVLNRVDGPNNMEQLINMGGFPIQNMADGLAANDAVTVRQAQDVARQAQGADVVVQNISDLPSVIGPFEGMNAYIRSTGQTFIYVIDQGETTGQWTEKDQLGDDVDVTAASHLTLAQAQASDLKVGQYVRLTDRGNKLNKVESINPLVMSQTIVDDSLLLDELTDNQSALSTYLNDVDTDFIKLSAGSFPVGGRITLNKSVNVKGSGFGTEFKLTSDNILFLSDENDSSTFEGFSVDGQGNGQLSSGLIQINASKNFRVRDVRIRNAGTIAEASPDGVNGLSIATNAFPSGLKSSGVIEGCVFEDCTKAPLNWTTYAEVGVITSSEFYRSVGNGETPAIQINGGRDFKLSLNHIDGTEGAGCRVAAVGTNPAYAARDIISESNTFKNIGTLGQNNSDEYAHVISDGFSTGDIRSVTIRGDKLSTSRGGFLRTIGGVDEISVYNIESENTTLCFDLQGTTNVSVTGAKIRNFNDRMLSVSSAYFLRNCNDINVSGGHVITDQADSYLVASNTGENVGVNIDSPSRGLVQLLPTNNLQYFKQSYIASTFEKELTGSTNVQLQLIQIPDGRSVTVKCSVDARRSSDFVSQSVVCTAYGSGGVATIQDNTFLHDLKNGVITGLFFDVTGSNTLRLRFLNSNANTFNGRIRLEIITD